MFNDYFFRKSSCSLNNVKKYCRAKQATDDNTAHGHCVLYTEGYKHILGIYDIFVNFNMYYLLLLYCNNGSTNAPQCYVISTPSTLLVTKELMVGQLNRTKKIINRHTQRKTGRLRI
jgi:hypothetical protein